MSLFVTVALLLAVVVAGGISLALTGRIRWAEPLSDPVGTLPPVLLDASPSPHDVEDLRFAVTLRGYRMDQVDQTLDALALALAERDRRIAELESRTATISDTGADSE